MAISSGLHQNRMVWRETKNGVFSVSNAYYLAKSLEARGRVSCSTNEAMTALWKAVWKIRGSSVVKAFLLKACRNILATKENLHKRHIVDDQLCPIYG